MKKILTLFILFAAVTSVNAQDSKSYFSAATESIFSWADLEYDGDAPESSVVRWAPVLNIQGMYNYNPAKAFGLFAGLAIRNVGYIADDPEEAGVRHKYRTYNLGIPAGIKIGNMDKFFIYGGYEIEFPFHYKEKKFVNGDKVEDGKITGWFSDRVEPFQQSILVGFEFPHGFNVKFKYYLTNFHNEDFTTSEDGVTIHPYKGINANIMFISLNYNLFSPVDKWDEMEDWK